MQYKLYRILRRSSGSSNNKPEKKIGTRCEILGIKDTKIPINIFMLYCNPNISCFEIKNHAVSCAVCSHNSDYLRLGDLLKAKHLTLPSLFAI